MCGAMCMDMCVSMCRHVCKHSCRYMPVDICMTCVLPFVLMCLQTCETNNDCICVDVCVDLCVIMCAVTNVRHHVCNGIEPWLKATHGGISSLVHHYHEAPVSCYCVLQRLGVELSHACARARVHLAWRCVSGLNCMRSRDQANNGDSYGKRWRAHACHARWTAEWTPQTKRESS